MIMEIYTLEKIFMAMIDYNLNTIIKENTNRAKREKKEKKTTRKT